MHASVWQAADAPEARGGGAAGGRVEGLQRGAGGDDDGAAWAVDTDEDEEDGAVEWEEVELPERNEDIDPEVLVFFCAIHGRCSPATPWG